MFKRHVPQETIERVARAMCIADHNDPDRKVTRYIQEHLNGIAQHKTYLPPEQHCVPAWELYAHLVPAAIEALEAAEIASVMNDAMQYWGEKGAASHAHQVNDPGHSTGRYDPVREMKQLGLSYEQLAADILNEPFENEAKRSGVDFLAANKASST